MENYKEETINHYNQNAKKLSEKFKDLMDLSRRNEFPKFIELLKGKKILDLGCGAGDHSLYFKEKGLDVVSIDISEKMIELCKEKGIDAKIMDIENLQFENKTFDGIWSVTSLLHVPKSKIKDVIKKLHDILKDDGILYVCVKEGNGEGLLEHTNTKRFFSFWQEQELIDTFKDNFELIENKKIQLKDTIFIEMFFKKKIS
jgi:SAM-dependent methyltransferase